jgi:hypothetical protein
MFDPKVFILVAGVVVDGLSDLPCRIALTIWTEA